MVGRPKPFPPRQTGLVPSTSWRRCEALTLRDLRRKGQVQSEVGPKREMFWQIA